METTVDLHETGVVQGRDDAGTRLLDRSLFCDEHGGGDVGVLDGERTSKAAALVLFGQFDER